MKTTDCVAGDLMKTTVVNETSQINTLNVIFGQ